MLAAIYADLPRVACKGLCHDSCTIVGASQLERDVLADHGITLSNKPPRLVIEEARRSPDGKINVTCPALSPFGRCTVYADRPLICRTFGTVGHPALHGPRRFEQPMMCDHGCEPEGVLSVEQFMWIMSEVEALSRVATGIARQPILGDSPYLSRLFQRDVITERAGFTVGPDIRQHTSEGGGRDRDRPPPSRRSKRRRG